MRVQPATPTAWTEESAPARRRRRAGEPPRKPGRVPRPLPPCLWPGCTKTAKSHHNHYCSNSHGAMAREEEKRRNPERKAEIIQRMVETRRSNAPMQTRQRADTLTRPPSAPPPFVARRAGV